MRNMPAARKWRHGRYNFGYDAPMADYDDTEADRWHISLRR